MNNSLYIGATGMQAQQTNLDTIANNLTNMNTVGFKKSRINFSELVSSEAARQVAAPIASSDLGVMAPSYQTGRGIGITGVAKIFDQGEIKKTESALDLAILGDGFLEVTTADGGTAFTRGGTLKVSSDGLLTTQTGLTLKPGITIPDQAQSITISSDGKVSALVSGQASPTELGQLELVRFTNPGLLSADGDNLYKATDLSGEPISGKAGSDGMGTLAQGSLEISNVKMVDEMVNLMVAQRAYEASVKIVQASDELMGMVNNLRK